MKNPLADLHPDAWELMEYTCWCVDITHTGFRVFPSKYQENVFPSVVRAPQTLTFRYPLTFSKEQAVRMAIDAQYMYLQLKANDEFKTERLFKPE